MNRPSNALGQPADPARPGPSGGARRLARGLLGLLIAGVVALGTAAMLAIDGAPAVPEGREVSHEDVARALAVLRAQDPRRGPPQARRIAWLSTREIELALNHRAVRWPGARTRVRIQRQRLELLLSLPIAGERWLNVAAMLHETAGWPQLEAVRIGALPVPVWFAEPLLRHAVERTGHAEELSLAREMVERVSFHPQHVRVAYAWNDESSRRLLATLVPPEEHDRLRDYARALAAATAAQPPGRPVALPTLMAPLFERARQRTAAGAAPAAENRAVLLTLVSYALGRPLPGPITRALPDAAAWPQPVPLQVTLAGRPDFALHFLVSAAIAIDGTSPLSKAVGIYKEVADARRGSGFSFNDIAADRAGTRLGEVALGDGARALQERLARGVADDALMPPWADLPEFLPEPEFRERFGGVDAPPYRAMLDEIDRRIAALPLLR